MKTVLGIFGACGRMGQRLVALAPEQHLTVGAALDSPSHPDLGRDAGEVAGVGKVGVAVTAELAIGKLLHVMIDFSTPEGSMSALLVCLERKIPLVIATTGHTPKQIEQIEAAAHDIPLLMAPNMSLSVNLLFSLTTLASKTLAGKGFDVEIVEKHHRFKKDSPSGTALQFAKLVQQGMGQPTIRHGREGLVGERPHNEIGIHAVRVGDNPGEHTIIFSTLGETLELVHKAQSRDSYARGALQAAKFLADRPAGRYSMKDVLGL